jgi:hypothetical protein
VAKQSPNALHPPHSKRHSRLRGALAPQIADHWVKYRPTMSTALKEAGQFETSVNQAADMTSDALADLILKGVPYDQAWASVREEWAFLPSEEDLPQLGSARGSS